MLVLQSNMRLHSVLGWQQVTAAPKMGGPQDAGRDDAVSRTDAGEEPAIGVLAGSVPVLNALAQVLLRWAMQTAQAVVTTSAKPERIAENFAVLQFELSESDVASITDAGRAKPPFRGFWQDSLGTPLS